MKKKDVVFFFGAENRNGELSNHFKSDFVIFGHTYCCVEQYMMAQKALIFKDFRVMNEILNSKDPVEIKHLGRMVEGFDKDRWDRVKVKVVKEAVRAKFSQNEELKRKLLETGDKMLVESNPKDRIWGIGFVKSNREVMKKMDQWGENLLGKILMEVREELRQEEAKKEEKNEEASVMASEDSKEEVKEEISEEIKVEKKEVKRTKVAGNEEKRKEGKLKKPQRAVFEQVSQSFERLRDAS